MADQSPTTALARGVFEWLCPKCGSFTYQYGDVLHGQSTVPNGVYDDRLRKFRACISCDWKSA